MDPLSDIEREWDVCKGDEGQAHVARKWFRALIREVKTKDAELAALRGENERLLNECRFLGKARWNKETELCQRIFEAEAALAQARKEIEDWKQGSEVEARAADEARKENAELKAALEAAKARNPQ